MKIISYFISKIKKTELDNQISLFKNYSNYDTCLMSTIPILFPENIDVDVNYFVENNIEAKKYYYPLDLNCINSYNLFKNIICLPLNVDITNETIDYYIFTIDKYLKKHSI